MWIVRMEPVLDQLKPDYVSIINSISSKLLKHHLYFVN